MFFVCRGQRGWSTAAEYPDTRGGGGWTGEYNRDYQGTVCSRSLYPFYEDSMNGVKTSWTYIWYFILAEKLKKTKLYLHIMLLF